MSTEGKIGFFAALWRLVSFYEARKALGLVRAADKMFTGSAEGIDDAFTLYKEQLVARYEKFVSAVSQAEMATEMNRGRLKDLDAAIADKQQLVAGADHLYDRAEASGDTEELEAAQKDSIKFTEELNTLLKEKTDLEAEIAAEEKELKDLEDQLGDMIKEIEKLPAAKAKEIAKFVSNKALIEARERISGLTSRVDSSPIDRVLEANNELAAKAKVLGKVTRAANNDQDDKYRKAATNTAASDEFEKRRAARQAEKAPKEATKDATTEKETRPKSL